jgi:N-acetylglucosaminyldiphosphoundecaprenol N-acetyl-beta-D-mannosaminyltransferase
MIRNEAMPPMGRAARRLVCLLGLPIDVVEMSTAVAKVRHAARTGQRCFISTPNLNFLMAAQQDSAFRESVLRSDLSLADGVSLLALARLMGVKLPERVSGADLFLELCASKEHPPLKVFFLGGPPGAAKLAAENVNRDASGVRCVGHDEGGFGDVESMSGQDLIDRINAAGADFVVVSLGAKKGQAWIMRNQMRLTAPVISHLGAVVNFTAGTVRRAPKLMQKMSLEWLWRALTEPGLSKRYWDDGRALVATIFRQAVRAAAQERWFKGHAQAPASIIRDDVRADGTRTLALSGHWGQAQSAELAKTLLSAEALSIDIDLRQVTWLDLYVLGTLAGHHGQLMARGGSGIKLLGARTELERQLRREGMAYLFDPQEDQCLKRQTCP